MLTKNSSSHTSNAKVDHAPHKKSAPRTRLEKPVAASTARVVKPTRIVKVKEQRPDLDIEHFRGLLLSERTRLESEREQIRNRGLDVDGALPEEGEGGEEDTADLAAAMMDKEMDLSVEDEIEDLLGAVDHALQKMDEGSYGICDLSGQPIPESRLELIPWASLTVECQALSEAD